MRRFPTISAILVRVMIALVFAVVLYFVGLYWDRSHPPSPGPFDRLLALLAIIAGAIAVAYEYALERSFQKIGESLSTRFLGFWPTNLQEISALAGTESDEFISSVDTIGYGHFSNHQKFMAYMSALEGEAKRGKSIKILLPPEDICKDSLKLQFKEEQKPGEKQTKLFQKYHALYKDLLRRELSSFEDFLNAELFVESKFCEKLVNSTTLFVDNDNCKPIEAAIRLDQKSHEPVYYWIARRNKIPKEAIFAYPMFSDIGKGYAFRTQDPKLMDIFSADFDVKWEKATKKRPEDLLYREASANFMRSKSG